MTIDYNKLIGGPPAPAPTPTNTMAPINAVGTASGGAGPFGFSPTGPGLAGLLEQLSNYTYSVPVGGYLSSADALNANSYYNKFGAGGGGNPAANQAVRGIYNQIGALPTTANTSPALAALNQSSGIQPKLGPSFNERLAELLAGPAGEVAKKAGFTSPYEGPFRIRREY